jgi:hypothetical protein
MLHADFVGSMLPKNVYYRAIANCGFFLNAANVWGGAQTTWSYMSVAAMANVFNWVGAAGGCGLL